MYISDLKLVNFRNYEKQVHSFSPGINVFIGDNAQGKTNLLEAVYYCSKGSSFKQVGDSDIIRSGAKFARLDAQIIKRNRRKIIGIQLETNGEKTIEINGLEVENLSSMRRQFEIVYFWPENLRIIKDGPSFRRELIDEAITGMKPSYGQYLIQYSKILSQRNSLLKKDSPRYFDEQLGVLTRQLAEIGARIMIMRSNYISVLSKTSKKIHFRISSGEDLEVGYDNFLKKDISGLATGQLKDLIYEKIMDRLEIDKRRRFTTSGPQRDDLYVFLEGLDIKTFGSQGQQRSAIISIKLAEVNTIKGTTGVRPILLLDDVFSELDNQRRTKLLEEIGEVQALITTNNFSLLPNVRIDVKKIEKGRIIDVY